MLNNLSTISRTKSPIMSRIITVLWKVMGCSDWQKAQGLMQMAICQFDINPRLLTIISRDFYFGKRSIKARLVVMVANRYLETLALESQTFEASLDLFEDLLEFLVFRNIFNPEQCQMVLLTFVQIICVIIVYSHLLQFAVDNDLVFQHCSDEYISCFDQSLIMLVLFNLQVEQADLLLLRLVIEPTEMLYLYEVNHCSLQYFPQDLSYAIQGFSKFVSCILPMQHQHRQCHMCQVVVTFCECIFTVMLVDYLLDRVLQVVDVLALVLVVEGETSEMRELWIIAESLHSVANILLLYGFLSNLKIIQHIILNL